MMQNELVIGIVGGMGSFATIDFFRRIVEAFPAEKEWERPRIIIDNHCTMPSRVRAILYNEMKQELVEKLSTSVKNLLQMGANKIVLACNTSHIFLPEIINNIPQSKDCIVNIIEECSKEMERAGITSAGLIATEGTIITGIYSAVFAKRQILINEPSIEQFGLLREFIESVKQNKIKVAIMESFVHFIENFEDEAVILGCTELPILYNACVHGGYKLSKKVFDPLQSTIEYLVSIEGARMKIQGEALD